MTEEKAKRANKITTLNLSPEQQVGGSNPSRRTIPFNHIPDEGLQGLVAGNLSLIGMVYNQNPPTPCAAKRRQW
jgi:hypothetical protein